MFPPRNLYHLTSTTLKATAPTPARLSLSTRARWSCTPTITTVAPRYFSAAAVRMTRVSDAIKQDHRDLEEAYNHIISATTDDEKKRWQNQFTWELARHSLGEELVVYPEFEKRLPNGKQMADKDRQEHLTLKEHLYKFQKMSPKDADFMPTIKTLFADLKEHIKEEEEHDLIALENALDASDSASLTSSFKLTKKFVPTQSHPSAPDKPPFETVAGLMAAPLDHLKDIFKKFPKEASSDMPP